jgi:hypothetical protein
MKNPKEVMASDTSRISKKPSQNEFLVNCVSQELEDSEGR